MKKLLPISLIPIIGLGLLAMMLSSCASTQPSYFQPTSLAPVEQAVTRVEQHVSGAKDAAKKLADVTDAATKQNKAWQDAYDSLNQELTNAYMQAKVAKDEVASKQVEIKAQTDKANQAVANYNTLKAKYDSLLSKYHRAKFVGALLAGLIGATLGLIVGLRLFGPYGLLGLGVGPVAIMGYYLLM